MGFYADLGVRTVINAAGTLTRLGGSRLAPEVLAAMAEASASFVHIDELQAAAGEVIAEITGAEAGYVDDRRGGRAGAWRRPPAWPAWTSRRWTACRTRPDCATRSSSSAAIATATTTRSAPPASASSRSAISGIPGAGGTMPWQIEAAITERTAAIACPILDTPGMRAAAGRGRDRASPRACR